MAWKSVKSLFFPDSQNALSKKSKSSHSIAPKKSIIVENGSGGDNYSSSSNNNNVGRNKDNKGNVNNNNVNNNNNNNNYSVGSIDETSIANSSSSHYYYRDDYGNDIHQQLHDASELLYLHLPEDVKTVLDKLRVLQRTEKFVIFDQKLANGEWQVTTTIPLLYLWSDLYVVDFN